MRARSLPVLLVSSLLFAGCFRATVRSGQPPGDVARGYDEHWHHGFVGGLLESEGHYALDETCPSGWSEVKAKTDPLDTVLTVLTWSLYSPELVTVVCAEPGTPSAVAREGLEPAPAASSSAYPPAVAHGFPAGPPPPDTP